MQKDFKGSSENNLRVLVCQTSPKFKDIDYNMHQAEEFLSKYSKQDLLDVILFPEMVFTGYCFTSKEDIRPYLEEAGKGKTFEFCSFHAKKLDSYIICGYPELSINPENGTESMYNSAYIIDRQGNLLLNYRKHFMYDIDYFWAEEGPGFQSLFIKNREGKELKVVVAICMDIEPYEMRDLNEFKLAEFCKQEEVDVLFLLCAWPDSEPGKPKIRTKEEVINYWINIRLNLLLKDGIDKNKYKRKWAFFCANRIGTEGDTTFVGGSCAFKCNYLEEVGSLGTKEEGFILADVLF